MLLSTYLNYRPWIIAFVSAIGIMSVACAGEADRPAELTRARQLREAAKSMNGEINVKGRVTDQEGNPLPDVVVDVRESRLEPPGTGGDERRSVNLENDGRFDVKGENINRIYLIFGRKGYYSKRYDFSLGKPGSRLRKALEGKNLPELVGQFDDVQVKLTKRGEITQLEERQGWLTFEPGGGGRVYSNKPLAGEAGETDADAVFKEFEPRWRRISWQHFPRVNWIKEDEALPEKGFYLEAKVDDKGRIVTVTREEPRMDGTGRHHTYIYPKKFRIVSTSEDVGFIHHEYDVDAHHHRMSIAGPIERQMRHAPKDGYKSELVFSGNYVHRVFHAASTNSIWFYAKIGEHYARCRLWRMEFLPQKNHLMWRMTVEYQPDGSRNLEIGR